jgi:hypothetical protein
VVEHRQSFNETLIAVAASLALRGKPQSETVSSSDGV